MEGTTYYRRIHFSPLLFDILAQPHFSSLLSSLSPHLLHVRIPSTLNSKPEPCIYYPTTSPPSPGQQPVSPSPTSHPQRQSTRQTNNPVSNSNSTQDPSSALNHGVTSPTHQPVQAPHSTNASPACPSPQPAPSLRTRNEISTTKASTRMVIQSASLTRRLNVRARLTRGCTRQCLSLFIWRGGIRGRMGKMGEMATSSVRG